MSKKDTNNTILLSGAPAGRFVEGVLDASSGLKPGHCVSVKAATEDVGGRPTFVAYAGTTGHRTTVMVLLEQEMIGYTCEDAISDGQKVRAYCPIPGDELLVRISATGTGTGDSVAIADKLVLANGGTLIATTGTPEMEPFIVRETISDVVAAGVRRVHRSLVQGFSFTQFSQETEDVC